jgi:hypothetical protein
MAITSDRNQMEIRFHNEPIFPIRARVIGVNIIIANVTGLDDRDQLRFNGLFGEIEICYLNLGHLAPLQPCFRLSRKGVLRRDHSPTAKKPSP